jgi:hypothetical protein
MDSFAPAPPPETSRHAAGLGSAGWSMTGVKRPRPSCTTRQTRLAPARRPQLQSRRPDSSSLRETMRPICWSAARASAAGLARSSPERRSACCPAHPALGGATASGLRPRAPPAWPDRCRPRRIGRIAGGARSGRGLAAQRNARVDIVAVASYQHLDERTDRSRIVTPPASRSSRKSFAPQSRPCPRQCGRPAPWCAATRSVLAERAEPRPARARGHGGTPPACCSTRCPRSPCSPHPPP